jgi:hypothetical protein
MSCLEDNCIKMAKIIAEFPPRKKSDIEIFAKIMGHTICDFCGFVILREVVYPGHDGPCQRCSHNPTGDRSEKPLELFKV